VFFLQVVAAQTEGWSLDEGSYVREQQKCFRCDKPLAGHCWKTKFTSEYNQSYDEQERSFRDQKAARNDRSFIKYDQHCKDMTSIE
jgi:hypothetical protein